jgi:hypothetical protein
MEREPRATTEPDEALRSHVNAALVVSIQSLVWTLVVSSAAIVVGLLSDTAVLVAFGGIGYVDAIGSAALVYHFRHARRHDQLSDDLKSVAHRIVLIGLLLVGCAAIVGGLTRLTIHQSSEASNVGVALAATSLVVLSILSARKLAIARRVSSNALRSDGHLSAIGAMQATVTLVGTAVTRWAGWQWADAAATTLVGCVAASLAVVTWRVEARATQTRSAQAGKATDDGKACRRARPVTIDGVGTCDAHHSSQRDSGDYGVIGVAEDRDEVGNQVDRRDEVEPE